ncbi:MAG: complex I NDUFA9 subunit family protein [Betaproteobacteria bacterium]|nr:complex I NDUFA9 subunit family protein [Betaproteobacteria bacterium]
MRLQNFLVLGGSGFVGRHLVAALAARGARVTVPARRRERAKELILLPTVDVQEADVKRPGVLERLTEGCDAVVNLVGILHSRRGRRSERGPNDYGPDFAHVHVELPQAIVAACRATGVKRLLHMSALGAALEAPSEYLRSKGVGEQAVLAADDLAVTVFRPSVIFGPGDSFLTLFARLARILPAIVLACPEARFQPVYVGDVVQAFLAALDEHAAFGQRYDLCGPKRYALRELVEYVCRLTGRRRAVIGLSDRLSYLQARLMEWSPGPLMTRDNYRSMQVPSVCDCAPPFGIRPAALEAVAPAYLAPAAPRYDAYRWRARRG